MCYHTSGPKLLVSITAECRDCFHTWYRCDDKRPLKCLKKYFLNVSILSSTLTLKINEPLSFSASIIQWAFDTYGSSSPFIPPVLIQTSFTAPILKPDFINHIIFQKHFAHYGKQMLYMTCPMIRSFFCPKPVHSTRNSLQKKVAFRLDIYSYIYFKFVPRFELKLFKWSQYGSYIF